MHLRHLLPALALLLLSPHASAQTRAVVANPSTGALVWPSAADFAGYNDIVLGSTLGDALDGLPGATFNGSPILTEATLPDSSALAAVALQKSGNLGDVPDIASARANLDLGTASDVTFNSVTVSGSATIGGNSVVTTADLAAATVAYADLASGPTNAATFRAALGLDNGDSPTFASIDVPGAIYVNTINASNTINADYINAGGNPVLTAGDLPAALDDNADANRASLSVPKITVSAAAPSDPAPGDFWLETTGAALTIWDGSTWVGIN